MCLERVCCEEVALDVMRVVRRSPPRKAETADGTMGCAETKTSPPLFNLEPSPLTTPAMTERYQGWSLQAEGHEDTKSR